MTTWVEVPEKEAQQILAAASNTGAVPAGYAVNFHTKRVQKQSSAKPAPDKPATEQAKDAH